MRTSSNCNYYHFSSSFLR